MRFIVIILFILIQFNIFPQPKREVRAVWLSTNFQLDWPPKTTNEDTQKKALIEILDDIKSKKFNTIFFQVRSQGATFYKSAIEPFSPYLLGDLGKAASYDPLTFISEEAHKRNIEVHAWINVFNSLLGEITLKETEPRHIVLEHPEWHRKNLQSNITEYWLDPGIPDVRRYIVSICIEIARNYNIDGIHLDYCRYPTKIFDDAETYKIYKNGMKVDDWRRDNINKLIGEIYDSCIAINPMLKIGSAPLGIYKNLKNVKGLESRNEVYQDSREWLKSGDQDYLSPQIYWEIDSNQDFESLVKDWTANSFNRSIIIGMGTYRKEILTNINKYINVLRTYKPFGFAFFRYGNISKDKFDGFSTLANIPPMKWKDNLPPLAPRYINGYSFEDQISKVQLEWDLPQNALDGDNAKYFNIYRSTSPNINRENPNNIIGISQINNFTDEIKRPQKLNYYYQVSSFDKGNNESLQGSPIIKVELKSLKKKIDPIISKDVVFLYPKPVQDYYYLYVELSTNQSLKIDIYNSNNILIKNLVNGYYKQGYFVFPISEKLKGKEKIKIKVTTINNTEEIVF